MNTYIMIGNYRYKTLAKDFAPAGIVKPGTVRVLANGEVDGSYAAAALTRWSGSIIAEVTPETNYGTIGQLTTDLSEMGEILFQDHYGTKHYVHIVGEIKFKSMLNMWDAASNRFYVTVNITKSRSYP